MYPLLKGDRPSEIWHNKGGIWKHLFEMELGGGGGGGKNEIGDRFEKRRIKGFGSTFFTFFITYILQLNSQSNL